ncbi:MAG: hypothetical protein J6A83_09865 [Clostridia bacterium]|nr:hypothetical protein [Clostridia bacterium]
MEKTKKKDRFMIISVSVLVLIVAVVLIVAFLLPVWSAKLKLSEVKKNFEGVSDRDMIVISDPLFSGELIPEGAEVILEGEQGKEVADALLRALDGAKYADTEKTIMGSWSMNVSIRTADDVYTVYFLEDEFYLADDYKQYVFTPSEDAAEDYDAFLAQLVSILEQSLEK